MRTERAQDRHDRFLNGVAGVAFTVILFIVGFGVTSASLGGGIGAAAGALAVAYVARLVIQSRTDGP